MSTNQRCNAVASVIGIFCHSTSAPEIVIEMLSHAGLSISTTSIHNMVNSLSEKSQQKIRRLAKTMLGSIAYDNFDMDFKTHLPTVEKSGFTLKHATSAIIFPLIKTTPEDLECSDELWDTNPMNPDLKDNEKRPKLTWIHCIPKSVPDGTNRPPRETRIFAWHFRFALVKFCDAFKDFQKDLGMPETINQISITKTEYVPCHAMDIDQSTTDGQGEILDSLCQQANIGHPQDNPGVEDISRKVMLVHGDLRTGELLELLARSRSLEKNPVRRLQFTVFVMGLFHYLMACGDAIWRMFIEPKSAREGPNSLYTQICKIRPYDSGRIGMKYHFRLMHDVTHQCGWARMLDCWRVELRSRNSSWTSLEAFAAAGPSWGEIVSLSEAVAANYLDKPSNEDVDFRNNTLTLARLLHYIELAHAMKHGDIGRVEASFLHWAFVFKTVRKHKYSAYLIKLMNDLKYTYNEKLQNAIRMNWLVNPTGKPDGFRGVDWVVELMNLYTKVSSSPKNPIRSAR